MSTLKLISHIKAKQLFLIAMLCSVFFSTSAQSLDSLIEAGLKNNAKIKSFSFKHLQQGAEEEKLSAYPAPSVGLSFSQMPFSSLNFLDKPFSQNISFSQMLPLGGKLDAMKEMSKSALPEIHAELRTAQIQLTAEIKMSYYKWAAAHLKYLLVKENISVLQMLKSFSVNALNNSLRTYNVLLLDSELGLADISLKKTKQEINEQITLLTRYTGVSELTIPDTSILSFANISYSRTEIDSLVKENNPTIKQMNAMVGMNDLEMKANEKELYPDLMLEAMLMRMPQGMPLTTKTPTDMIDGMGKTAYMYSLTASISLPFAPWSKKGITAKSEEISFKNKRIESEISDMTAEMSAKSNILYDKYLTASKSVQEYESSVLLPLANAKNSAILLYQSDASSITSFLSVQKMYLMEYMNYLMLKTDAGMALIEMEMMTGTNIIKRN